MCYGVVWTQSALQTPCVEMQGDLGMDLPGKETLPKALIHSAWALHGVTRSLRLLGD